MKKVVIFSALLLLTSCISSKQSQEVNGDTSATGVAVQSSVWTLEVAPAVGDEFTQSSSASVMWEPDDVQNSIIEWDQF